jgi:hypothetical protein
MTWEQVVTISTNLSTMATVVWATIVRMAEVRKSVDEIKGTVHGQARQLDRVEFNMGRRKGDIPSPATEPCLVAASRERPQTRSEPHAEINMGRRDDDEPISTGIE